MLLIGVQKSGLPELPAVPDGIKAMQEWARTQSLPDELVITLTDTDGEPVRTVDVYNAVDKLTRLLTVRQLIVYFCGHGVYNDGDMWLLSGAPQNPNEAVNLEKSRRLAERGTIPHVVFISDACRSATTTVQMSDMDGSVIFPSPLNVGRRNEVDFMYACRLAEVARQIAPSTDPTGFRPVYSEVVAEALAGDYADLLERVDMGQESYDVVRARTLSRALPALVASRMDELGTADAVIQVPDAAIVSDPDRWVSRLEAPPESPGRRGPAVVDWIMRLRRVVAPAESAAAKAEGRLVQMRPPPEVEISAALHVVGDDLVSVYSAGILWEAEGGGVQVLLPDDAQAGSMLLSFSTGRCAVLPVFRGRTATLTLEEGVLVDVRYRPVSSSAEPATQPMGDAFDAVRARIAGTTRFGVPWWQEYPPAGALGTWRPAVRDDPAFAVYVAYGLVDSGRRDLLPQLLAMTEDGETPFDVALLAEDLTAPPVPPLPLLSRGWALLGADGIADRPAVPRRVQSPWTLFGPGSFEQLREYIDTEGSL
ncbi:hypothetical protein E4P40_02045 [Blastococcus sp. CT_GayMR20]|uniref:hypothetical protein n=1 Tax=Blastococcus sp. CT_GayMR20 TaxID=2559609 RepID=UPI001073AD90|nr:hypothetical protein [Blastococcus sp. CT_GayMR20]TFV92691.1 hypothetical protein E4P40_01815 [Blastococcus sp. CT_GayMR20]TFV92728.1 hypothetical protein E4P40_02045 [Blastococcus sp. CT_GayMR20]